jgi:hypothetical protein
MHTFFVNTKKDLLDAADGNAERYLFANLRHSNKLINYNVGLDELSACARDICDVIDKDEAVGTEFNVIVYIDIDSTPADADVFENVYLMAVNENFAAILHSRRKDAQNIQVVFGEHFDRKHQFEEENLDGGKLWDALGFPSKDEVQHSIAAIVSERCDRNTAVYRLTEDFIRLQEADNTDSPVGTASDFHKEMVLRFIDALAIKIDAKVDIDLDSELSAAFTVISSGYKKRNAQNALQLLNLYVVDADEHLECRSTYRLYLYVYYCAAHETVLASIPEPNWAKFAKIIAERQLAFKKERAHVQSIEGEFDFLDIDGIGGENVRANMEIDLFPIVHQVPELSQNSKGLGSFLTAKKLKQQQETLLTEVAEKNERNEVLISDFIVQIRENYIDGKGTAMEQKRREFRKKKDGTKVIDSVELTHTKSRRFKTETEGYIAGQEDLQTENINFREQIKESRRKTDYWFDCLKWQWWFMVVFAAVWGLFFAAPYLWIQYSDLSYYDCGMPIFYVTMGIVGVIFWLCFFYFHHTYKALIKNEIQGIINAFNRAQEAKENNANIFKKRLTHFYPRSEVLRSYYEDVVKYIEEERKRNLLKDYHKRYLMGFSDEYIRELISLLDIRSLIGNIDEPDSATFVYRLNIDTIEQSAPALVDLYYLLNNATIKQVLNIGGAR